MHFSNKILCEIKIHERFHKKRINNPKKSKKYEQFHQNLYKIIMFLYYILNFMMNFGKDSKFQIKIN